MKVVALISGGKDSCYNMMQCVTEGHELIALANLRPKQTSENFPDELDSYMYQTVGHHAIDLYAEAMGLPLYRGYIEGTSKEQGQDYRPTDGDEVEDLYKLLKRVKDDLDVEAVSVGAILSNYQRVRVENVCSRLGLTPLAFLWRRDQEELLQEMITAGVEAIIIKVAAMGLTAAHLGKTLAEIQPHMLRMKDKFQLNVCGEGGEFESFCLDCPLFAKRIKVLSQDVITHSDDAFAPVVYLNLTSLELEDKMNVGDTFADRLTGIAMKRGTDILHELEDLIRDDSQETQRLTSEDDIDLKQDLNDTQDVGADPGFKDILSRGMGVADQGYRWITGIVSKVADGDSITARTELAMVTLKERLGNHGYQLVDAVLVHLYVGNMSVFSHINSVYCRYFKYNPPARVCVQVNLPADITLQIDCLVHRTIEIPSSHVDDGTTTACTHKHTMHVQSTSHWAPANIGPYSQAVKIGDLIFSAGTIGLCPSTMLTIGGGIMTQCAVSLRSLQRVLEAMQPGVVLGSVVGGVCYVTEEGHLGVARKQWQKLVRSQLYQGKSMTDPAQSMMCYVVVPRLPKDVLVEWHVVASTSLKPRQCLSRKVHGKASTCKIQLTLNRLESTRFLICSHVQTHILSSLYISQSGIKPALIEWSLY